ncbi:MAG: DnaJ domain-containing protein [Opitutales bacterium]
MVAKLLGLVGLGYLVLVCIRYFRTMTGGSRPQASSEENVALLEKRYLGILGLRGKLKVDDIKKAYRKKIAEYHPDKVQNMAPEIRKLAELRTSELIEAYAYFKAKYRMN